MKLIGVDFNSLRVRAVQGLLGEFSLPLPLDPPAQDLPLILSLEGTTPEVGQAGLRLCRRQPHLTCQGFLPFVGENEAYRHRWRTGRHNLDATQAMALVWKRLAPICQHAGGVILGLPSYLSHTQAELMQNLAAQGKISVMGSLPSPLAGALAGYASQSWFDLVLVLDIDDHALSLTLVRAVEGQAHVLDMRHLPHLGFRVWRERLLNALADLCVLQSRRDPRGSPQAEQGLFEQLEGLLEACHKGRMIQLGIQATQWFQNLVLQPEQIVGFCAGLVRQVLHEIDDLWSHLLREEVPGVILVTHLAGRLPGLTTALRCFMDGGHARDNGLLKPLSAVTEDFGENLLRDVHGETSNVIVLGPDAPARAAHALGSHFQRGDLPPGHLELIAPLPIPPSVESGPPRLHYQGQDYLLNERSFFLGCQDGCHLVVDDPRHQHVAARHCEIIFDHRTFILFNRSRDTTLVNDNPITSSTVLHAGDWIRLGPEGPVLRFLGLPGNKRTTLTA
jgi:hypothetical protein